MSISHYQHLHTRKYPCTLRYDVLLANKLILKSTYKTLENKTVKDNSEIRFF